MFFNFDETVFLLSLCSVNSSNKCDSFPAVFPDHSEKTNSICKVVQYFNIANRWKGQRIKKREKNDE